MIDRCLHGLPIEFHCEPCNNIIAQIQTCPHCGDGISIHGMDEHIAWCKPMCEQRLEKLRKEEAQFYRVPDVNKTIILPPVLDKKYVIGSKEYTMKQIVKALEAKNWEKVSDIEHMIYKLHADKKIGDNTFKLLQSFFTVLEDLVIKNE